MRGMYIGDIDEDTIIYELDEYDTEEWIFLYESDFKNSDSDWIYKAVGVQVPRELEKYKVHEYE